MSKSPNEVIAELLRGKVVQAVKLCGVVGPDGVTSSEPVILFTDGTALGFCAYEIETNNVVIDMALSTYRPGARKLSCDPFLPNNVAPQEPEKP